MTSEVYGSALTLFEPHQAVRGEENAIIQYFLAEEVDEVKAEILDASGNVVRTIVGTAEDEEEPPQETRRNPPPPPPTVHEGLNRFSWDLRYPGATVFDGIIIWSGSPERGPKAPPGRYQIRLTAAGETLTESFDVVMDPRLEGVTVADLQEQFALASDIRDKTTEANEAVIQIRRIRDEVNARLEASSDENLERVGQTLLDNMAAIEQELYQVENESDQDPLNFPIRLNNRLASLRRSVETGDAKPTDAAYQVFDELTAELNEHLQNLESVLDTDLKAFNELLTIEPVERDEAPEETPDTP
jgi:hypothetical protein